MTQLYHYWVFTQVNSITCTWMVITALFTTSNSQNYNRPGRNEDILRRHSCLSPFGSQETEGWIVLVGPWGVLHCFCLKGNVSSSIKSFPLFLRRKEWYRLTHFVRLLKEAFLTVCHLGSITKRFQGKKRRAGQHNRYCPRGDIVFCTRRAGKSSQKARWEWKTVAEIPGHGQSAIYLLGSRAPRASPSPH